MNLKPLKNKVAYVLNKHFDLDDRQLTVAVWKEFYSDYFQNDFVHINTAVELPNIVQIAHARKNLEATKIKRSTVKDSHPWYAR